MSRYQIDAPAITASVMDRTAQGYAPNLVFGGKLPLPFKIQIGDHHWRRVYKSGYQDARPFIYRGKCQYELTHAAEYRMKTLATQDRPTSDRLQAMGV